MYLISLYNQSFEHRELNQIVFVLSAASMLRPYVSEKNHWILAHHEIFQAYYYGDAMNINKNIRDRFKSNEYFKDCETFCER